MQSERQSLCIERPLTAQGYDLQVTGPLNLLHGGSRTSQNGSPSAVHPALDDSLAQFAASGPRIDDPDLNGSCPQPAQRPHCPRARRVHADHLGAAFGGMLLSRCNHGLPTAFDDFNRGAGAMLQARRARLNGGVLRNPAYQGGGCNECDDPDHDMPPKGVPAPLWVCSDTLSNSQAKRRFLLYA